MQLPWERGKKTTVLVVRLCDHISVATRKY